jgi:uncharacterized protein involved in exopolysaccharide biosynthesis
MVRRRLPLVIAFCGAAVVTSLLLSVLSSEKYEASAALFYRSKEITRINESRQDLQAFGSPAPPFPFKVINRTLEEIITSRPVLDPVVEKFGLDVRSPPENVSWFTRTIRTAKSIARETMRTVKALLKHGRPIPVDRHEEALRGLAKGIRISNYESYIYVVSYRDKDKRLAAPILDAVVDEVVHWLRQHEHGPNKSELERLDRLIAEKEDAIRSYRDEKDHLLTESRLASVSLEIENGAARLSKLKLERSLKENQIRKLRTEIEAVNAALDEHAKSKYLQAGNYDALQRKKIDLTVSLQGLVAQQQDLSSQVEEMTAQNLTLPALQSQVDKLDENITIATRDLVQLNDAYQQLAVRSQDDAVEIVVMYSAVVGEAPVSPIIIYRVLLTLFLAVPAAAGVAVVATYMESMSGGNRE